MAFARIKKPKTLKIEDLKLLDEEQSFYFHFEEIELLMKQPKAKAITIKKITVDGKPYIVLMAITNKSTLDGSTTLNEKGNLLALPCPKPAIPFGGVEIKIDRLNDIMDEVEQASDNIETTIAKLEKEKLIKKHETIKREVLDFHELKSKKI